MVGLMAGASMVFPHANDPHLRPRFQLLGLSRPALRSVALARLRADSTRAARDEPTQPVAFKPGWNNRHLQHSRGNPSDHPAYSQAEYLEAVSRCAFLTKDMFRICAGSIMMFQAMMEALINHSLEQPVLGYVRACLYPKNTSRPPFGEKWKCTLVHLGKSTSNFVEYHGGIYKAVRNPLVHPSKVKPGTFDGINIGALLNGYRHGWTAIEELQDGLGRPHDADSWNTMCGLYGLRDAQQMLAQAADVS